MTGPREATPAAAEDAALVRRLLAGDARAFDRFCADYLPLVFGFALRQLRDRALAEEMAQAAVCKALANLASFRGESALGTWLCACCRNEIASHFRRLGRRPLEVGLDGEELDRAAAATGQVPEPERTLLAREGAELVHAALDALPPRYGRALEWMYLERLPVREIGARLGVGPKAAESLLTRARAAFRVAYRRRIAAPAGLETGS
jgi:RNA polymerase sigma-70 factor (ECF subfamily)